MRSSWKCGLLFFSLAFVAKCQDGEQTDDPTAIIDEPESEHGMQDDEDAESSDTHEDYESEHGGVTWATAEDNEYDAEEGHGVHDDEDESEHSETEYDEDADEDSSVEDFAEFAHSKIFHQMDADSDGAIYLPEVIEFMVRLERQSAVESTPDYVADLESALPGKFTLIELNPQRAVDEPTDERMVLYGNQLEDITFNAADMNKDGVLDGEELPFFFPPIHVGRSAERENCF